MPKSSSNEIKLLSEGGVFTLPSLTVDLFTREPRVLVFDVETLAAGFADPQWVPQKVMAVAFGWADEPDSEIECFVCGPQGFMGPTAKARRIKMLKPLLKAINEADIVCGHNIMRFDLRVLNADCMNLGLPHVTEKEAQDTIRVWKSLGFKKGLDNIGHLLGVQEQKKALSYREWDAAYDEASWPVIIERAVSDVILTKQVRVAMMEANLLRENTVWRP